MATRFDELTYTLAGVAPLTQGLVTGITRSYLRRPSFTPDDIQFSIARQWAGLPALYGMPSVPALGVEVWFRGTYTGGSTDPSVQARALEDDFGALVALFTPYATPLGNASFMDVQLSRKDVGGSSIARLVRAVPVKLPVASPLDPLGDVLADGIYCSDDGAVNPYYHAGFRFAAPLGFFRDATATAPSVVATTGGATQSVGGGGMMDAGLRLDVTAASGSPTSLAVAGGGYSATLSRPSGNIQSGDYWDFYYTTDGMVSWSSAVTMSPGGFLLAPRTAANLTFTVNNGTVTVTVSYRPFRPGW